MEKSKANHVTVEIRKDGNPAMLVNLRRVDYDDRFVYEYEYLSVGIGITCSGIYFNDKNLSEDEAIIEAVQEANQ